MYNKIPPSNIMKDNWTTTKTKKSHETGKEKYSTTLAATVRQSDVIVYKKTSLA
jgi:hypothetical protein